MYSNDECSSRILLSLIIGMSVHFGVKNMEGRLHGVKCRSLFWHEGKMS